MATENTYVIVPLTEEHHPSVMALNETFVHYLSPMDTSRLHYLLERAAVKLAVVDRSSTTPSLVAFLLAFADGSDYDSVNYRWFAQHYSTNNTAAASGESSSSVPRPQRFLYIDRVVVAASAQGRGIGKALYAACEDWCRRESCNNGGASSSSNCDPTACGDGMRSEESGGVVLCCEVDSGNQPSLRFHQTLSFDVVGQIEQSHKTVSMLEKKIAQRTMELTLTSTKATTANTNASSCIAPPSTVRQQFYEALLARTVLANDNDLERIPAALRHQVPLLLPRLMKTTSRSSETITVEPSAAPSKLMTMIYILHKERREVLLGNKRRGFGAGNWNAFGGKVERGTDVGIVEAAHRELEEESGLRLRDPATSLVPVGVLFFAYPDVALGEPVTMTKQSTAYQRSEEDSVSSRATTVSSTASVQVGDCLYLEVHVFVVYADVGDPFVPGFDQPRGSEEMDPVQFVPFDQLPLDSMWRDDPYWLPQLLQRVVRQPHNNAVTNEEAEEDKNNNDDNNNAKLWFALYCQFYERDAVQFVATCPVSLESLLQLQREYER